MPTDARTLYETTLDQIVQDLSLKPSPVTTERFDAMFTPLLGENKRLHLESSKQNYYIISF